MSCDEGRHHTSDERFRVLCACGKESQARKKLKRHPSVQHMGAPPSARLHAAPIGLGSLPHDVITHLCTCLDSITTVSRMARTSSSFCAIVCGEPACWARVAIPATALDAFVRSEHSSDARSLHVRLPAASTHRPTFCHAYRPGLSGSEYISGCGSLLDAGVDKIISSCPGLVELRLPGSGHLSIDTLMRVLQGLPSLEVLSIRGCEDITRGFSQRSSVLPQVEHLRHVDLSHCSQAVDEDVVALLNHLPGLQSLGLDFCTALSDDVLEVLPSTVESLSVLGCARMSFDRLQAIGRSLGAGLVSDDAAVLACKGDMAASSLVEMLLAYRAEECRWSSGTPIERRCISCAPLLVH